MNTKSVFLLCMWLFAACFMQAQDKMPQAISYQAVARDAQGKVIAGKPVGIQVEILKGSTTGTVVFSETHTPTSSQTGTVNLLIGQGTRKTGSFSSVDWGADTYYLQLSMDLTGGSNYSTVSTTQMLPVPYALYAAKAGEVENGGNAGGSSSENVNFVLIKDDDNDDHNWLHNILLGNEVEGSSSDSYPFELNFSIVYLNGINQELNAAIEGLSENLIDLDGTSPSSSMGRFCSFKSEYGRISNGKYNLKLLIKNKEGVTIKEYPFVLNMK
ncbi:hypothetical protein [Parabacteroides sp.]